MGVFAPDVFETSQQNNFITNCQDCHMRDIVGEAANNEILRPDESIEHPNSGMPLHDLTGGNVWVPTILASLEYDNNSLLACAPGEIPFGMCGCITGMSLEASRSRLLLGNGTLLPQPILSLFILKKRRGRTMVENLIAFDPRLDRVWFSWLFGNLRDR